MLETTDWVSCPLSTPLHSAAYPPSFHKTLPQLWSLCKMVHTITKRQSPGFSTGSRFSLLPCPCRHSLCIAAPIPARATPVTLLFERESRAQKMNYEQNWDTVHGVCIIQTLVNGIFVWNKKHRNTPRPMVLGRGVCQRMKSLKDTAKACFSKFISNIFCQLTSLYFKVNVVYTPEKIESRICLKEKIELKSSTFD